MIVVLPTTFTFVAAVPPKLTVAPEAKPVPEIVTDVLPAVGPDDGETALTIGAVFGVSSPALQFSGGCGAGAAGRSSEPQPTATRAPTRSAPNLPITRYFVIRSIRHEATSDPSVVASVPGRMCATNHFMPRLAASLFIGNYVKGEEVIGYVDTDIDRWNVGGGGRAFLRLAYRPEPRFAIGLEGSYSFGWIDFGDDIGGDIQQGYLGFYIAHKF